MLVFRDADSFRLLQRFVLAEMIKTSQLDIASLANFVRMKQIEPDWMSMQLPNGMIPLRFVSTPGYCPLTHPRSQYEPVYASRRADGHTFTFVEAAVIKRPHGTHPEEAGDDG